MCGVNPLGLFLAKLTHFYIPTPSNFPLGQEKKGVNKKTAPSLAGDGRVIHRLLFPGLSPQNCSAARQSYCFRRVFAERCSRLPKDGMA